MNSRSLFSSLFSYPAFLLEDGKGGSKDTGFEIQKTWGSFLHLGRSTLLCGASYELVQRQRWFSWST